LLKQTLTMSSNPQISESKKGAVVAGRHLWLRRAGAVLILALLPTQLAGCLFGSDCSYEAKQEPCVGEHQYLYCAGGEGYYYDENRECPSDTPICVDDGVNSHQCVSE